MVARSFWRSCLSSPRAGRDRFVGVALLLGMIAATVALAVAQTAGGGEVVPVIRIKSPFAGPIWRLDIDQNDTFAVLSAAYKAVSLWTLDSPNGDVTLRVPIRPDQQKRAHAVAISPNGELIAYSVPPNRDQTGAVKRGTSAVYVMTQATGEIIKVIGGIETRPQALKFSPDGAYLAAGLSSACGVRMWKVADWNPYWQDADGYGGHLGKNECCDKDDVAECDELPDTSDVIFRAGDDGKAWLITSGDTGVRTYRKTADGAAPIAFAPPEAIKLERPAGIAISADGSVLAVGDRRSRKIPDPQPDPDPITLRIALLDVDTLKPASGLPLEIKDSYLVPEAVFDRRRYPDINQLSLDRVAWLKSGDEEYVFSAGGFPCLAAKPELRPAVNSNATQETCLVRWSFNKEGADPVFIPAGTDRVLDLLSLPKRGGLLYASNRKVAAIDAEGSSLELVGGNGLPATNTAADFRGGAKQFEISPDGKIVTFADYRGSATSPLRLRFNLNELTVTVADDVNATPITPDQDPHIIKDWKDEERTPPMLNGKRLSGGEYRKDETYRAATLLKTKSLALIGSSEYLRLIDYGGAEPKVLCRYPVREEAYRVNMTLDGTLVVAGHSDGTLRWYRIHPRGESCQFELLLSVYVLETSPGQWAWAAWRPSGTFANDPRAKGLLEWQITDPEGQIESVPLRKVLKWYDTEKIRGALDGTPGDKSREEVLESAAPNVDVLREKGERRLLKILKEPLNDVARSEAITFRVVIEDSLAWPKQLEIRLGNGEAVQKTFEGKIYPPNVAIPLDKKQLDEGVAEIAIELPPSARKRYGQFQTCFYLDGVSQACGDTRWEGKLAEAPKRQLWAVIVGFAKHNFPSLNLPYAGNDALDVARIFVTDYRKRVELKTSNTQADFYAINVDLAVSPFLEETAKELADLKKLRYVTLRSATRDGVLAALDDILKRANSEDLSNDILLFYFSGHGMIDPDNHTVFATPTTADYYSDADLGKTGLALKSLVDQFREFPGRKIVMLDACRTRAAVNAKKPMDPGLISNEFDDDALHADTFFSGQVGQVSIERSEFAFDLSRPKSDQGNSLFAYALLGAFSKPFEPIIGQPGKMKPYLDPGDLSYYFDNFFDLGQPDSMASKLRRELNLNEMPTPMAVPYNSDPPKPVLRTYEGP